MMKKLQNIAAIFAAGALLLEAASCSHDGGASLAALGAGSSGEDKKEEGKSVSYDFAELTAADITALQLESGKTLGQAALINNLNAKVLDSKVTIKQDQAKLKLKGNGDDPIAVVFGTDSAARTDSDAMPALTAGSALTLKRYISYPTTSGKKIQVKVECGEGMTNDIRAGSYLVLTSADNKVLVSKAISASDTSVTLDAFDSEDSFNLGILRGTEQKGNFYVGKVTITETSGSSNDPVVDPVIPPEKDETVVTVKWYDYSATGTTVAHTATDSDADVLTGGEFSVDVSEASITGGTRKTDSSDETCGNKSTEVKDGTTVIVTGAQWTLLTITADSNETESSSGKYWVSKTNDVFGSLSYTVTAKAACKITELSANIGTANTGSVTWKVEGKKNSDAALAIASADGKNGSFSKKLETPVELAENDTYTVTITAISKDWTANSASESKTFKATVGQVVVKAAAVE